MQTYFALIVIEDLRSATSAIATGLQPHLATLQQVVSGRGAGTYVLVLHRPAGCDG